MVWIDSTHIRDYGDEGVGDGEGEALWSAQLEALLHQGEAMFPTEQADIAQQMQRYLHILDNSRTDLQTVIYIL